jgi:hypothetical protein
MLQRTNKILIGKDISRDAQVVGGAVITTTTGSTGLADGEIVVLDKYFKVLAAGSTIADSDIIYICQGTGSTYNYVNEEGTAVSTNRKILLSDPIEGALVKNYHGVSYAAKAEQVTTITPDTPVLGTEYLVRIVYKDMNEHPGQFTQTYRAVATGTNVDTDLIDLLLAKINGHAGSRVVASGTTTLILTGKPIPACTTGLSDLEEFRMVEFEAFINKISVATATLGQWQDSGTVVYTSAADYGSGTWEVVRDMEKRALPYRGVTNFTVFPVYSPTVCTVVSATYDLIVIEHDKSYLSPDNQYIKQAPLTTVIAFVVPTTGDQESTVLGVLNTWMASLPKAFAAVSV